MNKGGQGLSLTTIVVAAIALLVLVILSVIFIGRMGLFGLKISECKGTCVLNTQAECAGTYQQVTSDSCDIDGDGKFGVGGDNGYCCLTVAPVT